MLCTERALKFRAAYVGEPLEPCMCSSRCSDSILEPGRGGDLPLNNNRRRRSHPAGRGPTKPARVKSSCFLEQFLLDS